MLKGREWREQRGSLDHPLPHPLPVCIRGQSPFRDSRVEAFHVLFALPQHQHMPLPRQRALPRVSKTRTAAVSALFTPDRLCSGRPARPFVTAPRARPSDPARRESGRQLP